jgi:hypothetical protein
VISSSPPRRSSRTKVDEWETPDPSARDVAEPFVPTLWVTQIEDLDSAAASGRLLHLAFDHVLRTHQALDLIALLERDEVVVVSLSLNLSPSIEPVVLGELLAAIDARSAWQEFQLRLDGSLDPAQRVLLSRSLTCLRLSADTVRPLLFGELLRLFEALDQPSARLRAELPVWRDFIAGKLLCTPDEELSLPQEGALTAWLRRTHDEALMWALATLLPAGTLVFTSLPDRRTTQMLAQAQLPYALSHTLRGARGLRLLCTWLRTRAGPALQAIELCIPRRPGVTAAARLYNLLMQRVQQQQLRALSLRLECDDALGDLDALAPGPFTQNRLNLLSLDLLKSETNALQVQACARLVAFFKPDQLALPAISVCNALAVVEAIQERPCLPLQALYTAWEGKQGRNSLAQWLRCLLAGFRGPGTVHLCAPDVLRESCLELLDESAILNACLIGYDVLFGARLRPGLRPGRAGLLNEVPPDLRWSYHRFVGRFQKRRQRFAAQALIQQRGPGTGLPVELAQRTLELGRFTAADQRAMAAVSQRTRRVGSALAIAEALIKGCLNLPSLRDLLTGPRGELDTELADALELALAHDPATTPRVHELVQAARSAFQGRAPKAPGPPILKLL